MGRKKALLSFAIIFLILGIQTGLALAQNIVYPVTINYNLSLAEMIKAGQYDWVNSNITSEHFQVTGTGIKKIVTKLVHFNQNMSSEDTLRELDKRGLRPATIEELLAFGYKYPKLQRQFPIVALGSFWRRPDDRNVVPYLWGNSGGRDLYLRWFDRKWFDDYRFLAVRK